mgnify:CR=1 FL=1
MYPALTIIGFLLGSLLFSAYLPKKLKSVDIVAASADKNPGGANAVKYAGIPTGLLCIFCDIAKGALPVFFASYYLDTKSFWFSAVMAAPVVGHAFSAFHKLHGGKCISVSFGVLIGLYPNILPLLSLAFFYILFSLVFVIRPNERRSVVSFLCFFAACTVFYLLDWIQLSFLVGALLITCIAVYKNYE